MTTALCPPRESLSSLLLGRLKPDESASLERHLDACQFCQQTVQTLDLSSDSVLASLQSLDDAELDAECRVALAGVLRLGLATSVDEAPSSAGFAAPAPSNELGAIREYKLLDKLGEGGMGAVYKAEHTRLRRLVAIKVLPDRASSSEALARFDREMQAVGTLDHPSIVRAFDAGEHAGRHYLVMEYVRGRDLSHIVRTFGPLAVADACEIIRQAAVGLQHAHEAGLVHRDVKPGNLMLSDSGQVKILDLGLARLSSATGALDELTSTGQIMGTIDYMAPEQGGDTRSVDIRADIYSLGASLYRLLTGEPPFGDPKYDTPVKKLTALAVHEPPPVQQKRTDVGAKLASVIKKLLAKSPSDRYAAPADVAAALMPFTPGADLLKLAQRVATAAATPSPSTVDTATNMKSQSIAEAGRREPDGLRSNVAPLVTLGAQERASRVLWAATALGGIIAVAFGVWLVVTDKDGKEVARHRLDGEKSPSLEAGTPPPAAVASPRAEELEAEKPESRPAKPRSASSVDRRAAEWVTKFGGWVRVRDADGVESEALSATELPSEAFKLIHVSAVDGNPRVLKHLDELQGLNHLELLRLRSFNAIDEDLERLPRLPKVTSLSLMSATVGAKGLTALKQLPELSQLWLSLSSADDEAVAVLKGSKITQLYLGGSKVTDAVMVHLGAMRELTMLELCDVPVSDVGASALASLPKLRWLSLSGTQLKGPGLTHLAGKPISDLLLNELPIADADLNCLISLPELSSLQLRANPVVTDAGLKTLQSCKKLTCLSVDGCPNLTPDGVKQFAAALPWCAVLWDGPQIDPKMNRPMSLTPAERDRQIAEIVLRLGGRVRVSKVLFPGTEMVSDAKKLPGPFSSLLEIHLEGPHPSLIQHLDHLEGLDQLKVLCLDGSGMTDDDLARLPALPNLESVSLADSNITRRGLDLLSKQHELQDLRLSNIPIGDSALTSLRWFKLRRLHVDRIQHGEWSFYGLSMRESLEALDLSSTGMTDKDMAHLGGLKKLAWLHLSNNAIDGSGLSALSALPIKELFLDGTPIADEHLKHLAHLSALTTLSLERNPVLTDAGLQPLQDCKNLKELQLNNCPKLTEDGVNRLRKSLPTCKIEWKCSEPIK